MRALGVMVSEVQSLMQNTATAYKAKIKNAINRAYRSIGAMGDWPDLRAEEEFTAAGTSFLVLPMYVDTVKEVLDTTNNIRLDPEPAIGRKFTGTYATSGTAYRWGYAGWVPVQSQPSVAATISIKGDSGSDTGTVVRIRGKKHPATSSGIGYVIDAENVTTAGASAATTTKAFVEVISVTKETDSTEDLIIHVGASYLGYLAMERYAAQYRRLRLHYVPSSGTVLRIQFQRTPERLVQDQDTPLFECSDGIVQLAYVELLQEQKQFAKAMALKADIRDSLQAILTAGIGRDRGAVQAVPATGMRRNYD